MTCYDKYVQSVMVVKCPQCRDIKGFKRNVERQRVKDPTYTNYVSFETIIFDNNDFPEETPQDSVARIFGTHNQR